MSGTVHAYTEGDYTVYCDRLAALDGRLARIINERGYPEFWHRAPGFDCLVRIILEQQVSLASAYAAFSKLMGALGEITPAGVLSLSDEALKGCGFSRQKTTYVRALAEEVNSGRLDLDGLATEPDEVVREQLIAVKGIG